MRNARQGAAEPAQPKNNSLLDPERYPDEPSQLFKWWGGSEHNSCLALVAEGETAGELDIVNEMSGLRFSQMYRILARSLRDELRQAENDKTQDFALLPFAARCYTAGRIEGKRAVGSGI